MTVRRSLFWSFSQQGGMFALQFLNMIVIARLLAPEEVGVFVLALSVVTLIQGLREMGLTNYLIRAEEVTNQTIRAVFGLSIVLCASIAILLWLGRASIETWIGVPGVAQALLPIVFVILIFPLEQSAIGMIRREMRFRELHDVSLLAKLTGVIVSIVLALLGFSFMALVWGLVSEAVARMVLLLRVERRHVALGPSLTGWRSLIGFGGWITGASLAGQGVVEGTKLILGVALGAGPTAIFDRAVRLPSMARQALFMPIGRVLLSSFSEDVRQQRDIGDKVLRLTTLTTGIIWPMFLVAALLSFEIVSILLGEQWLRAAEILPWLLLAQAILAMLPQPDQVLVPYGQVRRLFVLRSWQLFQALTIALISVQGGLDTFVRALPINAALFLICVWIAIRPFAGVSFEGVVHGHVKSALLAVAASLPVVGCRMLVDGPLSPGLVAVSLVVSALFFLGAIVLLKHPLSVELGRVMSRLNSKVRGRID